MSKQELTILDMISLERELLNNKDHLKKLELIKKLKGLNNE